MVDLLHAGCESEDSERDAVHLNTSVHTGITLGVA